MVKRIKLLSEKKPFQNTPTKQGDSDDLVFEDSSTKTICDTSDMKSNSQEQITSYGEISKLGETFTQIAKERENL